MTFRIQPLKGIFKPETYRYFLREAEAMAGYKGWIVFLFLISLFVYALGAVFGLGSESISKEINNLSGSEYEARKQLFFIGRLALGLFVPFVFLFFSSLFFWSYMNVDYRRIVVIQMAAFCLFLTEKIIQIPLYIYLQVGAESNPLSLGILAQYTAGPELLVHILSQITVFQIAMIGYICYYLIHLTDKRKGAVIALVIAFFTFYWIISGLFSYIKIGTFF